MRIHRAALEAPQNQHLVLPGSATLREALALLGAGKNGCQPWWHLVVERSDGTWNVARFAELYALARDNLARLDTPLERLEALAPARAFEQDAITLPQARGLLRMPPRIALVILRQGKLAGILAPEAERGGPLLGRLQVRDLLTAHSPPAMPAVGGAAVPRVRRYTDVSCPRKVALGTDRFSAVVRLTVDPSTLDRLSRALDLSPDLPVEVRLVAPSYELLNGDVQRIQILPDRDSPPAVFDLRPRALGRHDISFDFFQGGHSLRTVSLSIEVVREPVAAFDIGASLELPPVAPGTPPPDRVLRITWNQEQRELSFTLIAEGGASWQDFPPVMLSTDPAAFAEVLFETLTALIRQPAESATASLRGRGSERGLGIRTEIEKLGQNLWNLLPCELRSHYVRERTTWQRGSLLILSDEPYLPWELVWPYGIDWDDGNPWCVSLRLARWLRRGEQGEGSLGPPGLLPLRSLSCVVSDAPELAALQAERELLLAFARRHGLSDLSPSGASLSAVLERLEQGGYDWFHVAAHGSFSAVAPDQRTALWLERGRRALTPQHLVGPRIARHLGQQRSCFFFNFCHGARLAWGLTGLEGWAQRLLSLGAGMFLAPLWTVRDDAALDLADRFYAGLEGGLTVSEALRAARSPLEPSRLAYSLYGHPNARVAFG